MAGIFRVRIGLRCITRKWRALATFAAATVALLGLIQLQSAHAGAFASGHLELQSFTMTPSGGLIQFLEPWTVNAFAEASNSDGALIQDFQSGSGSASASANVMGVAAQSSGSMPAIMGMPNQVQSSVNLPGASDLAGAAIARTTMVTQFMITGGIGPVEVTFAAMLNVMLQAMTDGAGASAAAEAIFAVELDGVPILSFFDMVGAGPSGSQMMSSMPSLSSVQMLEYDVPYFLVLDLDTEPKGLNTVPEGGESFLLLLAVAGALAGARRWMGRARRFAAMR